MAPGMKQLPPSDSSPPGEQCPQPPLGLLLLGDKLRTEGHRTVTRAGQRDSAPMQNSTDLPGKT